MSVPLLVVSPHLDDGVLSCGRLLARSPGSVVLTVFEGRPDELSCWDRRCGFVEGDDVPALRRAEDDRALRRLGAYAERLALPEAPYHGGAPDLDAIAAGVAAAARRWSPELVLVPLGVSHVDHEAVSAAAASSADRFFSDQPYSRWRPDQERTRVAALAVRPAPFEVGGTVPALRKAWALRAYASQLGQLGSRPVLRGVRAAERYWSR